MRRKPVDPLWSDLQPDLTGGDIGDLQALQRLCEGAEAVIHMAGLVKACRRSDFEATNARGAAFAAAAARDVAPGAVFVLVSSLAARAPQLSAYAASKRAGETAVATALGGRAWIVRPPALYGPEDPHTLPLFRAAAVSPVLPVLRREARLPLLHVQDAARTIAALAKASGVGGVVELCDARIDGYGLREIMTAMAEAVGRRASLLSVPEAALRALGLAGDLARGFGASPMLTSGKVRELLHRDWSVSVSTRGVEPGLALPLPRFALQDGFRHTAAWYRAAGWL